MDRITPRAANRTRRQYVAHEIYARVIGGQQGGKKQYPERKFAFIHLFLNKNNIYSSSSYLKIISFHLLREKFPDLALSEGFTATLCYALTIASATYFWKQSRFNCYPS